MRGLNHRCVMALMFVVCGVAAPLSAQTDVERTSVASAAASPTQPAASEPSDSPLILPALRSAEGSLSAFDAPHSDPQLVEGAENERQAIQQPAGPPPTPRHTGIKAMLKGLGTDVKHLPSRQNLFWVGVGGGLALAAHPFDDDVNRRLVGSNTADKVFKPGAILGSLETLLGTAAIVYTVGRVKDEPKVSHVGMDLIRSLLIAEGLTEALKYTTRRERPDGSGPTSFPSGHAADTFAFATALERHLGWRGAVPAYIFSSYVAISRLPANRHWLSDAVFGSAVGIIAGRTVTRHGREEYPVAITFVPGGAAVMFVRRNN